MSAAIDVVGTTRGGKPQRPLKLSAGQHLSTTWPGHVRLPDGRVRKHVLLPSNRRVPVYYLEKNCTHCSKLCLQFQRNSELGHRAFCSIECKSARIRTERAGSKIKKMRPNGDHHVLVKTISHSRLDRHGYVYEHILEAEKKIGRSIAKGEIVHHVNCIKNDNRQENLHVFVSSSDHFKSHGSLNKCVSTLIDRGVLKFNPQTGEYEVVP